MLAFYAFAVQGTRTVVTLFSAFIGSFAPKIYFNFARGNNQEYLLKKLTIIVMILSYISAFVIFIGANYFVKLILPSYMRSVPFLKIFALMIIPFAQYNIAYVVAIGKNRVLPILKGISILLGVAALLNWIMYKYFGMNGIAWATVICVFLAYTLVSIVVSSSYKLRYLTILFLPILLINLWIVSINLKLGVLMLAVIVIINSTILYYLKDTKNI